MNDCLCTACAGINAVNAYPQPKMVEVPQMSRREFADEIVNYAIDVAMDDLKLVGEGDTERRIKLYRKAGLELVLMAAQMDAEQTFGV